ncbi:hypothetical protein [Actinomadura napierensis]|uniref:hypothetical protein n=1 Tax=Actinomadura napierensis TaxID=267854 RepID=UPI0031D90DF7
MTRTPNGPVLHTFTPYGNMMLMQSKMKDTRVSATSGGLKGDNGVYALASKDRTGASLMVWNWQHTGTDSYHATIDMSRLPADLRHGQQLLHRPRQGRSPNGRREDRHARQEPHPEHRPRAQRDLPRHAGARVTGM